MHTPGLERSDVCALRGGRGQGTRAWDAGRTELGIEADKKCGLRFE